MRISWLEMGRCGREWGSIPIIKIKRLGPKHAFLLKSDGLTQIPHREVGLQLKKLGALKASAVPYLVTVTWERCGPVYGREEKFSHCSKTFKRQ